MDIKKFQQNSKNRWCNCDNTLFHKKNSIPNLCGIKQLLKNYPNLTNQKGLTKMTKKQFQKIHNQITNLRVNLSTPNLTPSEIDELTKQIINLPITKKEYQKLKIKYL